MSERILKSFYAKWIEDYIDLRMRNGFSETSFVKLYQFDQFLYDRNYRLDHLTKEIIDSWCLRKKTEYKNNQIKRISEVRQFCKYLNTVGITAYIPKNNISRFKPAPYVLTYKETTLFFKELDGHFKNRIKGAEHYRYMIPVIMRVLYLCGLRNGEACFLKIEDILHDKKALKINDAKNHIDRIVYCSDDCYEFLMAYVHRINIDKPSIWLFPSTDSNTPILQSSVCEHFSEVLKICHIGNEAHHPTPHSLRHTYVVHRIDEWIKDGENVDELMPCFSKQLGHSSISGTYYYYHMLSSSYGVIKEKDRNIYPEVGLYEE